MDTIIDFSDLDGADVASDADAIVIDNGDASEDGAIDLSDLL